MSIVHSYYIFKFNTIKHVRVFINEIMTTVQKDYCLFDDNPCLQAIFMKVAKSSLKVLTYNYKFEINN